MTDPAPDDMPPWQYPAARDNHLRGRRRWTSEQREVGLVGLCFHGLARLFNRLFLKTMVRIEVEGREFIPTDLPFVIVANHSSHLDALLISHSLPVRYLGRFFALAAEDYFFDTPSKSLFAAQWVNALPLKRGKASGKALGALRERLVAGECGYIIFPEGTRSRNGCPGPFKPGIGMLVAGTPIPVLPCHIRGSFDIWPPDRRLPRPGKVAVRFGEPICFSALANEKTGWLQTCANLEAVVENLGTNG